MGKATNEERVQANKNSRNQYQSLGGLVITWDPMDSKNSIAYYASCQYSS